jgi:hypothetical protein
VRVVARHGRTVINVRHSAQLPGKGKDARTLESPQIESGDIVSGLTAGHQIGNQLPGHGRQCQANVSPYRIEDTGAGSQEGRGSTNSAAMCPAFPKLAPRLGPVETALPSRVSA